MTAYSYRAGAVFYVLWGLLHLYAAWLGFELAATEGVGMVQAKLYQNAWNLGYIALFSIAIGAALNWRNSAIGYWLNIVTVSVTDIGFIIFVLLPGHSTDLLGPILWLIAATLTTVGYLARPRTARGATIHARCTTVPEEGRTLLWLAGPGTVRRQATMLKS